MDAEIDGNTIQSERDFHRAISMTLNLPAHYGENLDALWDVLSCDVERPVSLTWKNAGSSQAAMPESFDLIVSVLRRVEQQDIDWGLSERFELKLC